MGAGMDLTSLRRSSPFIAVAFALALAMFALIVALVAVVTPR